MTINGCIVSDLGDGRFRIFAEKGGGSVVFDKQSALMQADLQADKFLNFDITYEGDNSMCFAVDFIRSGEGSPLSLTVGLLPKIRTQISLPLTMLDGQRVFFKATPGKLKTTLSGKSIELSDVAAIALRMQTIAEPSSAIIENLCISDTEQEYLVPEVKLVDDMGQLATRDWQGKTKSIDEMVTYLRNELARASENTAVQSNELSEYGGWVKKQFKATGWFRTEQDGDRWWLVDPLGYAFVSAGIDCVAPDGSGRTENLESFYEWLPLEDKEKDKNGEFRDAWGGWAGRSMFSFAIANLIRAFGKDEWFASWSEITKMRLSEWGMNTIANWSDFDFIKWAKMPYVFPLNGFPTTQKKIFRDFPDVFSEEYKQNAQVFAKQLEPMKDDPYLIGYFLGNEPLWAFGNDLNIAEELLATDFESATKTALIEYLESRYSDITAFNDAWQSRFEGFEDLFSPIKNACSFSVAAKTDLSGFSKEMVREFIAVPSTALRQIDPHHMNLGIRYAWFSGEALLGGIEHFDVFSFNCYAGDPTESLKAFAKVIDLPFIIGEYHHGALDRGMLSTGIGGVATQQERGKAYRYYTERALAFGQCVGAHYFILNDQPLLGRLDGENYNIGFVDVCNRPYQEFIDGVKATTACMYDVSNGAKDAFAELPEYTPNIFF